MSTLHSMFVMLQVMWLSCKSGNETYQLGHVLINPIPIPLMSVPTDQYRYSLNALRTKDPTRLFLSFDKFLYMLLSL